ncbi:CBU_0592 family membrane protein [Cellulophaga fucicola]|uniref:CBU_0592 family membrane protein n=1 Tax=Cellulophaga fucicola TaxID=76595 RepID=UPI003EC08D23
MFAIIGWLGALLFIVSYLLLSIGRLSSKSKLYHMLNILGAVCLIANGFALNDFPNIVVNAVWAGIGVYAIVKIVK